MKITPEQNEPELGYPSCNQLVKMRIIALSSIACALSSCSQPPQGLSPDEPSPTPDISPKVLKWMDDGATPMGGAIIMEPREKKPSQSCATGSTPEGETTVTASHTP